MCRACTKTPTPSCSSRQGTYASYVVGSLTRLCAWACMLLCTADVFVQASMAVIAALKWSGSETTPLFLLSSMFHVICLQAFCKDVLQQPAEDMPRDLRERALPRCAMRYYWLQARGHRITPKWSFARDSPAKFAERYGSTEVAIEEWRQHWLQSPEGRLYGGEG